MKFTLISIALLLLNIGGIAAIAQAMTALPENTVSYSPPTSGPGSGHPHGGGRPSGGTSKGGGATR